MLTHSMYHTSKREREKIDRSCSFNLSLSSFISLIRSLSFSLSLGHVQFVQMIVSVVFVVRALVTVEPLRKINALH